MQVSQGGKRKGDRTTRRPVVCDPHVPAVQFDNPFDYCQADAAALRQIRVEAREGIEDPFSVFWRNARAIV